MKHSKRQGPWDMGRRILAIRPVLRLCLLLPCGRQGLSAKRASHWQVLSTHTERSGDVMFVLGGLAEENMVPIGASFDNGMRNDCHDAVSAELIIPIGVWSSQPAVAAASAEQALEPGHPAEAGRPAAGETMLSKQMESPWQFFKRIENLLIAPGHFGPRGGWKRILFEKSLPKRGS